MLGGHRHDLVCLARFALGIHAVADIRENDFVECNEHKSDMMKMMQPTEEGMGRRWSVCRGRRCVVNVRDCKDDRCTLWQ